MMLRRQVLVRLTATAAILSLMLPLSGCFARQEAQPPQQEEPETGVVAIFTPADGLTISQHTPLNKWQELTPEISEALQDRGFGQEDIHIHTSDDLNRQSRDLQDYVVDALTPGEDDPKAADITLVVAPAAETGDATRQYGDYVSGRIVWHDDAGDEDADPSDGERSEDETRYVQAAQRMVTTLDLAREAGMTIVLLSNAIEGFAPDAFVQMSDAERIGTIQAQNMVDKLNLDATSVDNPKSIEVLLPFDATTDGQSDDGDSSDEATQTDQPSDEFAAAAFRGVWTVLAPYFKDGRAVCPSGKLTAETTADDWRSVAFDASDENGIRAELTARLNMDDDKDGHTRIDGVIAMNDYVASVVTDQLSELGYVGTSADINPSITISGIVGNITGRKDITKQLVPDPIKAPEETESPDDEKDIEQINSRWPIVTGYGAYRDIIPGIVDGQQWMTALEDRLAISKDIAEVCARLDAGEPLDAIDGIGTTDMEGEKVPTLTEPLVAVSAGNLKEALIDPGYITLADAGL
ncbi:hypothetical protein [Bifidobacterium pullorum]|uniref:hypothetical protein n=1 Tax=Bifidobacterium pullorum TaxID=78448 RepID=UPI0005296224|nr:hypothetical protein [Bifidobacterium pullorum]